MYWKKYSSLEPTIFGVDMMCDISSLQSLIKKKKVFNEAGQFHIAKFVLQTLDSSNVQRFLLINGV